MIRKNDRDGLIVIAIVILACVVLIPMLWNSNSNGNGGSSAPSSNAKDASDNGGSYYAQPDQGYGDGSAAQEVSSNAELFPFDPNTADSTTLLRLGLKPWQVRSIYRYRAKGGRYYKREDFARLYGLTLEQYRRLEPYIQIAETPMAKDVVAGNSSRTDYPDNRYPAAANSATVPVASALETPKYPKQDKISPGQTIDINTADTTQLKRIPGIGSYFARRIVELRQRRGAFATPRQLLTINNFPESSLAYMTASSQNIPAIHVNSMTQQQLQQHPLLNYVQARDIINLRRTRGTIRNVQELSCLSSFSPELIKQITPLLRF